MEQEAPGAGDRKENEIKQRNQEKGKKKKDENVPFVFFAGTSFPRGSVFSLTLVSGFEAEK